MQNEWKTIKQNSDEKIEFIKLGVIGLIKVTALVNGKIQSVSITTVEGSSLNVISRDIEAQEAKDNLIDPVISEGE